MDVPVDDGDSSLLAQNEEKSSKHAFEVQKCLSSNECDVETLKKAFLELIKKLHNDFSNFEVNQNNY